MSLVVTKCKDVDMQRIYGLQERTMPAFLPCDWIVNVTLVQCSALGVFTRFWWVNSC